MAKTVGHQKHTHNQEEEEKKHGTADTMSTWPGHAGRRKKRSDAQTRSVNQTPAQEWKKRGQNQQYRGQRMGSAAVSARTGKSGPTDGTSTSKERRSAPEWIIPAPRPDPTRARAAPVSALESNNHPGPWPITSRAWAKLWTAPGLHQRPTPRQETTRARIG